tara:strand:- start:138 stop:758 length:621 start_codon:yes stop_codon:yes gene_type:complete
MIDLGDRREGDTWSFGFTTYGQTGSPKWADSPTVVCYKGTSNTEASTEAAGLTLTEHDSREGLYILSVATTNAFYAPSLDYLLVFSGGTVDNVPLDGACIATFSIANRLMQPFPGIEGKVKAGSNPDPFNSIITCTGVPGSVTSTHYANQALLWTSGVLKGLTFFITGNGTQATDSLSLTLQTLPAEPSDTADSEDTFIILGTKGS